MLLFVLFSFGHLQSGRASESRDKGKIVTLDPAFFGDYKSGKHGTRTAACSTRE